MKKKKIPKFLQEFLSEQDISTIADAIADAEKSTSGEIRVSIREKRHRKEKNLDVFGLAHKEFHHLGLQRTRDRTGVLLFFLFEDRKFQILADTGIYSKISQSKWDEIAQDISAHLKKGNFCAGIRYGIDECGKLLTREFPVKPDDINELPDDVSIS